MDTSTSLQSNESNKPLDWIRLELVPLPNSTQNALLLYLNPEMGVLQGEGSDLVKTWVAEALKYGFLAGPSQEQFEITDPLRKPSELAAILAQYYWVIPEPVEATGGVIFEPETTYKS